MKKTYISLLFFSLLGLIASILLTQLHFKAGGMGLDERSFCHVSEFFDCDAVLMSRYATIGSIPNSEIGVIYYLLVAIGLIYAWVSSNRRGTLGFLFISSLFAVAYSVVMAYLSVAKLETICLLCFANYIASLFLMILLPKALEIRYSKIPRFLVDYVRSIFGMGTDNIKPRLLLHVVVTIAFFGFGLIFFRGVNPQIHKAHAEIPREDYLRIFYSLPQKAIDIPANAPFWGNEKGSVQIVEFSDFQCPFCRRAAFTLKPYLREYQNNVKLIYMNYPLDSSCNPALTHSMHPVSCIAAKAALCAHQDGKFRDFHDSIFENQKRLSRSVLLEIAGKLGMDSRKFEECLTSEESTARLKEDVEAGNKLDIHGTPTVYINGRAFRDWLIPERLRLVIESEIAASLQKK